MLPFMGENKKLLKLHEKKFVELDNFKSTTQIFQENTNS